MKILVGCEESQTVTIELRKLGHEAYSCDIQECSGGHTEWHIQDDVLNVAYDLSCGWQMMIGHPPCTVLSNAGIGWFNEAKYGDKARKRKTDRLGAAAFFMKMYNAPIKKICLENPVGYMNSAFRKPDQVIQPYFFGDPYTKKTCLWLIGLPKLIHTNENTLFEVKTSITPEYYFVSSGSNYKNKLLSNSMDQRNAKIRSKTFPGIAHAMATQWASNLNESINTNQ